jgi:biopolymer transport protein ExbD
MAEINLPQKSARRKVQAPRIDFTPMVDLGFLLITFFMITTTLAKPKTLELRMPTNEQAQPPTAFPDESTITLIPVNRHKVVYYYGALNNEEQLRETTLSNIRDILLRKKNEIISLPMTLSAEAHKLHVVIKPNDNCKYEDVVSVLDEMNICDVTFYALVDVSSEEKVMIGKKF